MIRKLEALNFRCLRYCSQAVDRFQIMVGANASGKSTFLDIVDLLGGLLAPGQQDLEAVRERAPGFEELLWMRKGSRFELAVELDVPAERAQKVLGNGKNVARYEIAIGTRPDGELGVLEENLLLTRAENPRGRGERTLFPNPDVPPGTIMRLQARKDRPEGSRPSLSKSPESGQHTFHAETSAWKNPFRLGPRAIGLANMPEDEGKFPVAVWVRDVLRNGVQRIALNGDLMRKPSPPLSPSRFKPDGSNLSRAIEGLSQSNPGQFQRWLAHVRTSLPDIRTIETVERPEDRHRYLVVVYANGLRAPSWTVSDGTLRLLALTLLAYLGTPDSVYLVEEPENGIHPQAVETVFQSLSSSPDAQILCATHSPVLLALAKPEQVLCFARSGDGATDIVRGDEHPNLKEWRGDIDLGTYFATGMLG